MLPAQRDHRLELLDRHACAIDLDSDTTLLGRCQWWAAGRAFQQALRLCQRAAERLEQRLGGVVQSCEFGIGCDID
jgi:hypothetical protein